MKIRMSLFRKLVREALLREAQMQDPLAVAVGTAIVNHMNSPAFLQAVQKSMAGKKGDVDRAAEELAVTFPQSQLYRAPLEKVLRQLAGSEQQEPKQQFARSKPTEDGTHTDDRATIAPPPPKM